MSFRPIIIDCLIKSSICWLLLLLILLLKSIIFLLIGIIPKCWLCYSLPRCLIVILILIIVKLLLFLFFSSFIRSHRKCKWHSFKNFNIFFELLLKILISIPIISFFFLFLYYKLNYFRSIQFFKTL